MFPSPSRLPSPSRQGCSKGAVPPQSGPWIPRPPCCLHCMGFLTECILKPGLNLFQVEGESWCCPRSTWTWLRRGAELLQGAQVFVKSLQQHPQKSSSSNHSYGGIYHFPCHTPHWALPVLPRVLSAAHCGETRGSEPCTAPAHPHLAPLTASGVL